MSQDNIHARLQSILQFMMSRGCVKREEFSNLLVEIGMAENVQDVSDDKIALVIAKCNKKATQYHMMIRSLMDEAALVRYYVFISTVDNEVTHVAHYYSKNQFEFFKLLLVNIVTNPCGVLNDDECEDLAKTAGLQIKPKRRNTPAEHRRILDEWISRHWFITIYEGERPLITLGVRTMAELDVFIKQNLIEKPTDLNCKSCDHISIHSSVCNSCGARYHKRCSKMEIDRETGTCRHCPSQSRMAHSTSRNESSIMDDLPTPPVRRRRTRI